MTKDEALRLAIESLCCVRDMVGHPDNLEYIDHQIAKIEAALEAKDEPVAWLRTSGTGSPVVTEELLVEMPEMRWNFQQPLYTTPPQRTWVGLTDEDEIDWEEGGNLKDLVKAIEAKLKEKNT
jgi:hypothetical protein